MATNFPGGIDTFVNPTATSSLDSPSHAGLHTDLADGMTAVQTQLVNNPYGLVHIKTVAGTAVSAINIDNCFSTTYDVYEVNCSLIGSSANFDGSLRLRASGVDNSSSNYERQLVFADNTTLNTFRDTLTSFNGFAANANSVVGSVKIFYPAQTQRTSIILQQPGNNANLQAVHSIGRTTVTTAYDGISVIISSGNVTGTVSVFGYRKS
jgi:hypothetical protein